MDIYKEFLDHIKNNSSFLVVSHYNPDGDAIGSSIAMGMLLEKMGKKVSLYNRDGVPPNLKFLPWSEKIASKLNPAESYDVAVMVDCGQRKRISEEFAAFGGYRSVLCVDHHLLETPEADVKLIDSGAASTGEVVYRILNHVGFKCDADFAQCIYTTIVVDTGFFKYSNTSADVLGIAADLIRFGASSWEVAKNLEESHPASRMKLLGESLQSIEFHFDGKYATMDVTEKMLKKTGATMDQSDEFATFPRAIGGVEVSALFREIGDGKIKISMRSKDFVDVAAVVRNFGGGGHARAAGCQIKCSLKEAKEKVLEEINKKL